MNCVRKEAVLSSQIEGTQSSLSDLLLFEASEAPGVPLDDVVEVSNYVAALEHGLARVREGFPLSGRLLREIHEILLHRGRGAEKQPGEFRRSQNGVGGTRPGNAAFVPPPDRVPECIGALERWLHDEPGWEAWLGFFADGVRETAAAAVGTAQRLVRLFQEDRVGVQDLGRSAGSALRLHAAFQERPIATAAGLAERTGLSIPAVNDTLVALAGAGIIRELTGRRRNRLFSYDAYLRILSEGTEPL